jgi:hypothetical protein
MRISIITINGIEQEALAASAPVAVCRAMQRFGARELNGATITVRRGAKTTNCERYERNKMERQARQMMKCKPKCSLVVN